jgi:hypothetical protein
MRRRGSGSFIVEVKKRRFPQNIAAISGPDRKSVSAQAPTGASGFPATPFVERESISNPAVEAAKMAATRFFSGPGSARSAGVTHRGDPVAHGVVHRVVPARPADVPEQKPAALSVASAPPLDGPRSGRVLQSLIVAEDPIEALLRREAEEKSARRRRGRRARVVAVATEAALPGSSPRIPTRETAAGTSPAAALASTDRVAPSRKVRGRTAATEHKTDGDTPAGKPVRRRTKATKAPRRAGSLRRTASAGAAHRAAKRAAIRSLGKKGVAKRAAARREARKTAALRKTSVRKGALKRSIGRPAVSKKRIAARRPAAPGRIVTHRTTAKTKRSAAGPKPATRGPKPATRRARGSR